jgi:catechol 2,3-dioxygenase-like lactoylglutathione lyase family enzyme
MDKANVRYIVRDLEESLRFYCGTLGFEVEQHPGPGFASITRGQLRLLLSALRVDGGGAVQPMPDGALPQPGGWNRIQLRIPELDAEIARLDEAGARFRNRPVQGKGGRQILLEDPSGNLIELFQPQAS